MANMQNLTLVTQMPPAHGMLGVGGALGERRSWVVDSRNNNPNKQECLQSPSSQGRLTEGVSYTLELCEV